MPELIPFRWPKEWTDPAKLAWLQGTPINCLVGEVPPPFPTGALKFVKLEKDAPPEGIATTAGVWPRVLPPERDVAEAGPTGAPWVDSNVGHIRLAQTRDAGKPVWLTYTPPTDKHVIPLSSYARSVAEAAAHGAQWVITLGQPFLDGLEAHTEDALRSWKRMVTALEFFQRNQEWAKWEPVAALAVVSSFAGETELLSYEFLNMAPRRQLAFRTVLAKDVPAVSFERQKAIVYIEPGPPEGEVLKRLLAFVEAGGLLISPRGIVKTAPDATRMQYQFHRLGKGQIAVPPDAWYDPYLMVRQVHLLVGHRLDVVRVWNGGDVGTYYLSSPKGDRAVVHLVQYGAGPTQPVTLGFDRPYRSARVTTLESRTVLQPVKGQLGVEFNVGEFSDYAAVELEA
ncbi:MAG: hypothetical protein IT159_04265 [Bryobacterales bacterium]|nr:hypothetical protein [Bryobacterales bacterium]